MIAGGDISNYDFVSGLVNDNDFVVCADGGIISCEKLGLKAQVIVGDFDSTDYEYVVNSIACSNAQILRLNPSKDYTDTEFALDYLIEKGFKQILLIGALGGRVDHTIANIFLMEKYHNLGADVCIADEKNVLRYAKGSTVFINKSNMKYISVLPLEDAVVSGEGLKFPMTRVLLKRASSLGVSNEVKDDIAAITIHEGAVIIAQTKD